MNNYEQRQQDRKERYEALAIKKSSESQALYESSRKLGDLIPFGQPILVGHHSEKRHRKMIETIDNRMRKSIEVGKTAEYYQHKADNMSNGISSDDPSAIEKLKTKLTTLQDRQADMKTANAEARANKTSAPFEGWALTNNNAMIRNVKLRIEQLSQAQNTDTKPDITGTGYTLHEDKDLNRIQFLFDSVPSEEIRDTLKYNGFRWSPTNKAWQRQLNSQGRYKAQVIISKL